MSVIGLTALGGVLGLDGTSVGQFMISRPLVAGVLAGALVGDPLLGGLIGAVFEVYLLVSFPTGGSRFPEGATATVVAVGSSAGLGIDGGGTLALAIGVGLAWGHVGGLSITWLRRLNGHIVPQQGRGRAPSPSRVTALQVSAVALDFARAALVVGAGLAVGRMVVTALAPAWPLDVRGSVGLVLVGASVSLGILLRDFGGFRKNRVGFVIGMALGLVGARFL